MGLAGNIGRILQSLRVMLERCKRGKVDWRVVCILTNRNREEERQNRPYVSCSLHTSFLQMLPLNKHLLSLPRQLFKVSASHALLGLQSRVSEILRSSSLLALPR